MGLDRKTEVLRTVGFPGGTSGKESRCRCERHERHGFIPGLGRSPREGSSNPLQDPCLESPMERGAWQATVHTVAKSWMQLSTHPHTHTHRVVSRRISWVEESMARVAMSGASKCLFTIPCFLACPAG